MGLPLCVRLSTVTRHGVRLQGNIRLLTATFYTLNPVRSCGDATGRTFFFSVRWLKAFLFAEHYCAFDRMCFYTGNCEARSALSSLNMLRCRFKSGGACRTPWRTHEGVSSCGASLMYPNARFIGTPESDCTCVVDLKPQSFIPKRYTLCFPP